MKKEKIKLIGIILIALAIYLGLGQIKIEISTPTPNVVIDDNLSQKLYQKKLKEYQDWGYANGLTMAKRILKENEQFRERGWEDEILTCEQIVNDLYEAGYQKAIKNPED